MNSCKSIRWAFNFTEWKPTRDQWKLALQCVQKEEKERINRFVYLEDCKSSLVGQLLMRKAANETLIVPYNKIIFSRTDSGKPFVVNENDKINFNVSHHGEFCVLASEQYFVVGIDVMKIEYRGKKPVCDYFNLMKKQFSHSEWEFITLPGTEKERLQRFYRLWCLKESYVKAIGTGIACDLQSLSFSCQTFKLKENTITTDTKLYVEGKHLPEWQFEESVLDADHYVAVAICCNSENSQSITNIKEQYHPKSFMMLSFDELMKTSVPFESVEENYWESFSAKCQKTK